MCDHFYKQIKMPHKKIKRSIKISTKVEKKKKYQEALICNPSSLGIRKTLIDKIYGCKAEKREKNVNKQEESVKSQMSLIVILKS